MLAVSRFGKLDVFVGNAGVRDGRKCLEGMGEKELTQGFDDVFGVNVKGYMIGAAAAREELIKSQGCIVLAPDIRVNGVAPSGTPTSFADAESLLEPDADRTLARTGGPNSNILERQTEPDDHAASYVLLASDQSAVMTGRL